MNNYGCMAYFIEIYSANRDEAWAAARGMYELDWSLIPSKEFDIVFFDSLHQYVAPFVCKGSVVWIVVSSDTLRSDAPQLVSAEQAMLFGSPVAAATWWAVEKSNQTKWPAPAPVPPQAGWQAPVLGQPLLGGSLIGPSIGVSLLTKDQAIRRQAAINNAIRSNSVSVEAQVALLSEYKELEARIARLTP